MTILSINQSFNQSAKTLSIVIASVLSLSACMSAYVPSAEERAQQQQAMQMILGRMQQQQPMQQAPAPAQQPIATITEPELAVKMSAIPQGNGGVKFERRKDGISINGNVFVDNEGSIGLYGYDYATGDMTYLVGYTGNWTIKYSRALTGAEPVILGTAKKSHTGSGWEVQTATGKKIVGDRLFPTSKGFVVARESTLFNYVPGKGVNDLTVPQGFHVAEYQNGDVATTGFMLVERDEDDNKSEGMMSNLKSLGSTLGINKKEDYKLTNISSGQSYPLDISLEGKNVGVGSNCKKKNSVVNECQNMTMVESLYDKSGLKNNSHYFWRVTWFNTTTTSLLIALEGGRDITITDLKTGKKVVAFSRMLGISEFDAVQSTDGKITLIAQVGLTKEKVDDVAAFLANAPEQAIKQG